MSCNIKDPVKKTEIESQLLNMYGLNWEAKRAEKFNQLLDDRAAFYATDPPEVDARRFIESQTAAITAATEKFKALQIKR